MEGTKVEHTPIEELKKKLVKLNKDPKTPKPGQVYKHYKGTLYVVVNISLREENEEPIVNYFGLKTGSDLYPWSRTLADWNSQVKVNGELIPRFSPTLIRMEPENLWQIVLKSQTSL